MFLIGNGTASESFAWDAERDLAGLRLKRDLRSAMTVAEFGFQRRHTQGTSTADSHSIAELL